jgi:hypothetical protein
MSEWTGFVFSISSVVVGEAVQLYFLQLFVLFFLNNEDNKIFYRSFRVRSEKSQSIDWAAKTCVVRIIKSFSDDLGKFNCH